MQCAAQVSFAESAGRLQPTSTVPGFSTTIGSMLAAPGCTAIAYVLALLHVPRRAADCCHNTTTHIYVDMDATAASGFSDMQDARCGLLRCYQHVLGACALLEHLLELHLGTDESSNHTSTMHGYTPARQCHGNVSVACMTTHTVFVLLEVRRALLRCKRVCFSSCSKRCARVWRHRYDQVQLQHVRLVSRTRR